MPDVIDAEQALRDADAALGATDIEGLIAHLSTAIQGLTAGNEPRRCPRL